MFFKETKNIKKKIYHMKKSMEKDNNVR